MYAINLDTYKIIKADLYRQADAYRLARSLKGGRHRSPLLEALFGNSQTGARKNDKKA